tara:strand:- start:225 stop:404 length:180 start_codon:yes stop_codon:yes gene_type:complete
MVVGMVEVMEEVEVLQQMKLRFVDYLFLNYTVDYVWLCYMVPHDEQILLDHQLMVHLDL